MIDILQPKRKPPIRHYLVTLPQAANPHRRTDHSKKLKANQNDQAQAKAKNTPEAPLRERGQRTPKTAQGKKCQEKGGF